MIVFFKLELGSFRWINKFERSYSSPIAQPAYHYRCTVLEGVLVGFPHGALKKPVEHRCGSVLLLRYFQAQYQSRILFHTTSSCPAAFDF